MNAMKLLFAQQAAGIESANIHYVNDRKHRESQFAEHVIFQ